MTRAVLRARLILGVACLFSIGPEARADALEIRLVQPNLESGTLTVRGSGFGPHVRVELGDARLAVSTATAHEIVAALPPGLAAGARIAYGTRPPARIMR